MSTWDLSLMVREAECTGSITIEEIPVSNEGPALISCTDDTVDLPVEVSDWCAKVLKPYQLRNLSLYLKEACDELPPEDSE